MKISDCVFLFALAISLPVIAQTAGSPAPVPPMGSTFSLGQIDQLARQTVLDLSRVRVNKWKADGDIKEQNRNNIESLEKNLSAALPALMRQVEANPNGLGPAVKLYRNLNVLYDVLASVTESTGAFGSKEDYQALANDVSTLDNLRRNVADKLEQMASAQDNAYAQLLNQARAQQQAAAAAPPKKVIIDDNEPVKKTAKKKKSSTANSNPK